MIWLIIGVLGIGLFLAALVLAPVWVGMGTLKESALILTVSLVVTGIVYLFSWALAHGITQVFG